MNKISPKMRKWLKKRGYDVDVVVSTVMIRDRKLEDPYWWKEFNKWIMKNRRVNNFLVSILKAKLKGENQ